MSGKSISDWAFSPMYGSKLIHDKAISMGMYSEMHTVHDGGHSLHVDENGELTNFFYDTIIPVMTDFLYKQIIGGDNIQIV